MRRIIDLAVLTVFCLMISAAAPGFCSSKHHRHHRHATRAVAKSTKSKAATSKSTRHACGMSKCNMAGCKMMGSSTGGCKMSGGMKGCNMGCSKPAAGHSAASTSRVAIYSCPMHPEVKSSKPANCPKCGMALVRKGK